MRITRHVRITGRVQGVGFRESLVAEAHGRGIQGWVRNRSDGSVEAVMAGEESDVQALIAWAHRGPPSARVDSVVTQEMTTGMPFAGTFERRPTL